MSKPKKFIDWDLVETLAGNYESCKAISRYLGMSISTLHRGIKQKHGCGFEAYVERLHAKTNAILNGHYRRLAAEGDRKALEKLLEMNDPKWKEHKKWEESIKKPQLDMSTTVEAADNVVVFLPQEKEPLTEADYKALKEAGEDYDVVDLEG